jgi:wyosine [tRNA(Phe)-imidazoG37] synthetase (radical SAM superfamily)
MITFGPVPSRRLGKSLGINNIVIPKVCSYNCVYCQVGKTREITSERRDFFDPEKILHEMTSHLGKLEKKNYPDYLTFVSNGEPTLDKNLGNSIRLLKKFGIPIAVISNGSMLNNESVRKDLMHADWVSLKMDAPDNTSWMRINRPTEGLDFAQHILYVKQFAGSYKGLLCTETMLLKNYNDSETTIQALAEMVKNVNPYRAYLAIPIRPSSLSGVKAPDSEKINKAWQLFNAMQISTELLIGFEGTHAGYTGNAREDILNITAVHPLREDSLFELLHHDKANYSVIESLLEQDLIAVATYNQHVFYLRKYND